MTEHIPAIMQAAFDKAFECMEANLTKHPPGSKIPFHHVYGDKMICHFPLNPGDPMTVSTISGGREYRQHRPVPPHRQDPALAANPVYVYADEQIKLLMQNSPEVRVAFRRANGDDNLALKLAVIHLAASNLALTDRVLKALEEKAPPAPFYESD